MFDASTSAKTVAGLAAALSLALCAALSYAEEPGVAASATADANTAEAQLTASAGAAPSSEQLEKDLQRLPWAQFKSVVFAIPKLKADVDAFGQFGWQYVQANYQSYGWKRNIDKLDESQKKQLAALIQKARHATEAPAGNSPPKGT